MVKMEQDLVKLKLTVEQLTEKCTDLESRSRRQNIRILNIKEGAESGVKPRDFAAQLLTEALSLEKPHLWIVPTELYVPVLEMMNHLVLSFCACIMFPRWKK